MRSVGISGVAAVVVAVAAFAVVIWAGTTHPFADRSGGWWCNAHRTDILVSGSTPLGWTEPHWGSVRETAGTMHRARRPISPPGAGRTPEPGTARESSGAKLDLRVEEGGEAVGQQSGRDAWFGGQEAGLLVQLMRGTPSVGMPPSRDRSSRHPALVPDVTVCRTAAGQGGAMDDVTRPQATSLRLILSVAVTAAVFLLGAAAVVVGWVVVPGILCRDMPREDEQQAMCGMFWALVGPQATGLVIGVLAGLLRPSWWHLATAIAGVIVGDLLLDRWYDIGQTVSRLPIALVFGGGIALVIGYGLGAVLEYGLRHPDD